MQQHVENRGRTAALLRLISPAVAFVGLLAVVFIQTVALGVTLSLVHRMQVSFAKLDVRANANDEQEKLDISILKGQVTVLEQQLEQQTALPRARVGAGWVNNRYEDLRARVIALEKLQKESKR